MSSALTNVTFFLEKKQHRRWECDPVCLAGQNPGFELCHTAPSKRKVKCSLYNMNLLADAYMETQAELESLKKENEALKAKIKASTPPPTSKIRREDAPEFAETVPRLFRVGKCDLYNQEGWLFDEHGLECVGFWNGKDIEPFEDEDTDDEN